MINRRTFLSFAFWPSLLSIKSAVGKASQINNATDKFEEQISIIVEIQAGEPRVNIVNDCYQVTFHGISYSSGFDSIDIVNNIKLEDKKSLDDLLSTVIPGSLWQIKADFLILSEFDVLVLFPDSLNLYCSYPKPT